jgi:hypothetical protein
MTCECKKVIGTLEQERDRLESRVERLEAAAAPAANELSELIEEIQSEWSKESCKSAVKALNQLRGALGDTSAASLLLHDAGVLEGTIATWRSKGFGQPGLITHICKLSIELRKQAAEQESKS